MTPDALLSSYKRYKEDTRVFCSWLASAALAVGHRAPAKSSTAPSRTPKQAAEQVTPVAAAPRLKGKARKQARDAAAAALKKHSSSLVAEQPDCEKHTVTTKDIELQIAAVAAAAIKMPWPVFRALQRALSARQRCAEWYSDVHKDDAKSNSSHRYFITLLQTAIEKIAVADKPTPCPTTTLTTHKTPKTSKDIPEITNAFDALQVEDVEEEYGLTALEASKLAANMEQSKETRNAKVFELETTRRAEAGFAAICFVEDLHQIQGHIEQTWQSYQAGNLDLVTASLVTSTAIALASRGEKELCGQFPDVLDLDKRGSYSAIANHLWEQKLEASGKTGEDYLYSHESLRWPKFQSFLFSAEARILSKFLHVSSTIPPELDVWPPQIPRMRDYFDMGDANLSPSKLDSLDKDDELLSQLLMDVMLFESAKLRAEEPSDEGAVDPSENFAAHSLGMGRLLEPHWKRASLGNCEDEFSESVRSIADYDPDQHDGDGLTFRNVFASRLLLDANRIMQQDFRKPHQQISVTARTMLKLYRFDRPGPAPQMWGQMIWPEKDIDLLLSFYSTTTILTNEEGGNHLSTLKKVALSLISSECTTQNRTVMRLPAAGTDVGGDVGADPGKDRTELASTTTPREASFINANEDPEGYFKRNPLWCGNIALKLLVDAEEAGVSYTKKDTSFYAVAHLYNAAKQAGLISFTRPVFEEIMDVHAQALFAGPRPKTPAQMAKVLQLRVGLLHRKYKLWEKQQPQKFKVTPLTTIMRPYADRSEALERPLCKLEDDIQRGLAAGSKKGPSDRTELTPLRLLRQMETYIPSALSNMTINYINLSNLCRQIMEAVRKGLGTCAEEQCKTGHFLCAALSILTAWEARQGSKRHSQRNKSSEPQSELDYVAKMLQQFWDTGALQGKVGRIALPGLGVNAEGTKPTA